MNAGGCAGACKINCWNTTGGPILFLCAKFSADGSHIDFSAGAACFRHHDQSFCSTGRTRLVDTSLCRWWKICWHNLFLTKENLRASQQLRSWGVSRKRDSTLREPRLTEGPVTYSGKNQRSENSLSRRLTINSLHQCQ